MGRGERLPLDDEGAIAAQAIELRNAGRWRFEAGSTPNPATFDDTDVHYELLKLISGATVPTLTGESTLTIDEVHTDATAGIAIISPATGGRLIVNQARFLRNTARSSSKPSHVQSRPSCRIKTYR